MQVATKDRMRNIRQGIILALSSIIFTMCALEAGARLFLPVSDYPFTETTDLGLQRIPNQEGRWVYNLGDDVNSTFSINAQGWNAPYDYTGQPEIAVIGDSQVEALYVDPGKAFPDLLPERLAEMGCPDMTTYRFGISGAPLSSYYVVMQHVIETYQPRIIVVNLVDNDFTESVEGVWGWGSVFWQVNADTLTLDPPEPYEANGYDLWRYHAFALRRFWLFNLGNAWVTAGTQVDAVTSSNENAEPTYADARAVSAWLILQMQTLADEHDITLLWIPDINREYVYGEIDSHDAPWQADANAWIDQAGGQRLDLLPAFEADYAAHHERFEFRTDLHWNERAHQLVAGEVSGWIAENACGE
jgi:hypothetical protein